MAAVRRVVGHLVPTALLLGFAAQQWSVGRTYRASSAVALGVGATIVAALVAWPRVRWVLPAVAPLLVAALVGILLGPSRAVTPAAIGLAFAVLLAAGVDVAPRIDALVSATGRVLTVAAGGLVFIIVVLPGWAWSRLRRRDPLRAASRGSTTWAERSADATGAAGSLGAGTTAFSSRRTPVGRFTWAVGCVALLLGVNFGAGWAWDEAVDRGAVPAQAAERASLIDVQADPRANLPAMAAYPWRDRYFADIQRTRGGYWPFTESRPADFTSPYVNQQGWLRQTYQVDGAREMPTVWMFGGSTTWGEGQRDEYTIASWLARLAEEDGVPIRIANYGQRGWTHFQEMVLYEQQLALGSTPDFSIFYDGANEITTQSLLTEAVPSHTLAYTYAQRLGSGTIATDFVQQPSPENVLNDVWHAYTEHSALHKATAWLRAAPAGAAPSQQDGDDAPGRGFTGGQQQDERGGIYEYDFTPQDGTDAGQVYERGKQLTMSLSERYDVESFLFWQPVGYVGEPQRRASAELTEPTIDLSDILEDEPGVFIDGGHTNEEGARLVAVEIWERIVPAVRDWYETRQ